MALLNRTQRDEVVEEIMRLLSSRLTAMPAGVVKAQLIQLVDDIDVQLDLAEVTIFTAIRAGAGKTWLQQNQTIGREFVELVERKRKEEL